MTTTVHRANGTDFATMQLAALHAQQLHVKQEFGADFDLDALMETVDKDPRYILVLHRTQGGLQVQTDLRAVRDSYDQRRKELFTPGQGQYFRLKKLVSDWYVFLENVPSRRHMQWNREYAVHTAMFFPVTRDAIIGEILWERNEYESDGASASDLEVLRADVDANVTLPLREMRNGEIYEKVISALGRNDFDSISDQLADNCSWVTRNYWDVDDRPLVVREGRVAVANYLRAVADKVEVLEVTVLNFVVGEWFCFSEQLFRVRTKSDAVELSPESVIRTAFILPIDRDGRIEGCISYGLDPEAVDDALTGDHVRTT